MRPCRTIPRKARLKQLVLEILNSENNYGQVRAWTAATISNYLHYHKKLALRSWPLSWAGPWTPPHHAIDTAILDLLLEMERNGEISSQYGRRARPENVIYFRQFKVRPLLEQLAAI